MQQQVALANVATMQVQTTQQQPAGAVAPVQPAQVLQQGVLPSVTSVPKPKEPEIDPKNVKPTAEQLLDGRVIDFAGQQGGAHAGCDAHVETITQHSSAKHPDNPGVT